MTQVGPDYEQEMLDLVAHLPLAVAVAKLRGMAVKRKEGVDWAWILAHQRSQV